MKFKEQYGPWALVTGATSGIGSEISKILASKGLNVFLVARRQELLDEKANYLKDRYGVEVKTLSADLTRQESIKLIIDSTSNLEIGFFVPNAGLENHGLMTDIDLGKELAVLQMNVVGVFALAHHYLKKMVTKKRGGILLVSSVAGQMPNPYMSNYAGTKAYIQNFGLSLRYEMKKMGIDITVLSPGPTDTPMMRKGMADVDITKSPMTVLSPEYVAEYTMKHFGKKPLITPGAKNRFLLNVSSLLPTSTQIESSGKMMDKAMK